MITFTIRNISKEEKLQIKLRSPSIYKRIGNFILLLIFITFILVLPLLIFDHFRPVQSSTQAIYCIAIVLMAFCVTVWINMGGLRYKKTIKDDPSQVEVITVKTARAIKREDFEDFGIAFYIDIVDQGQQKTLYLWGQYLDELEYQGEFPNTEFEITRIPGNDEFMSFRLLGHYFKEEKTLPAFQKSRWQSGEYPVNGEIINQSINTTQ